MSDDLNRKGPVYRCPHCHQWFKKGMIECLTLHIDPPCCHEWDFPVTLQEEPRRSRTLGPRKKR